MLYLYRRVIFGKLTKESLMKITDMSPREWAVFAPLIILTLWMGIYPSSFLDVMHVSVADMLKNFEAALAANNAVAVAAN